MTPAALAANKANAQKAGRPKGKISLSDISFRDRCRMRDEEHIAILEHIARYSENEGFRLAAIRDLFDRGHGRPRQAIEGSGPGGATPFVVQLPLAFVRRQGQELSIPKPKAVLDNLSKRNSPPLGVIWARIAMGRSDGRGVRRQDGSRGLPGRVYSQVHAM